LYFAFKYHDAISNKAARETLAKPQTPGRVLLLFSPFILGQKILAWHFVVKARTSIFLFLLLHEKERLRVRPKRRTFKIDTFSAQRSVSEVRSLK
jgi:hypothetical protein